jgi:hypothetical protein
MYLQICCAIHGVDPAFALAVAHVESRGQGQEFRFGPLGKKGQYYGPFGIDKSFQGRWGDLADPRVNIEVGVRALRGKDKLRVLRRYNRESSRAYEAAVMAKYRQLRKLEK